MLNEPVVGKSFFGRSEILSLLDKRIKAMKDGYRQNVALTGQSLAGKSSLLQHFLYTALDDSFLPVYVEVLREDFPAFARKFATTLLYNALKTNSEGPQDGFDALLKRAERFLPKTAHAVKAVFAEIEGNEHDSAYTNLLNLTSVVREETAKPCVVILDEFDNISYFKVKNPFQSFGKVIMIQKDTMYIISSSRNTAIKKILQEKLSLLFGNFELIDVKGFDKASSLGFMSRKSAPLAIDDATAEFITYFSGGNPFYIEHIVVHARALARENQASVIDREIVEEALLNLVYAANGTIHQYLNGLLLDLLDSRTRDDRIAVLAALADGKIKQRDLVKELKRGYGDLSKTLAHLVDIGLVGKTGVFHYLIDPMLSYWLKHVHLTRKRMLVNYIIDKTRAYRDDLKAFMDDYAASTRRTPLERVVDLFSLFSNDLIEMEDRQIMLPQCDKVEIGSFNDITPYVVGIAKDKRWIAEVAHETVDESRIAEFIRNLKSLDFKATKKILVPLSGLEENARLLAKELKISVWGEETIDFLLRLYGKVGLVPGDGVRAAYETAAGEHGA